MKKPLKVDLSGFFIFPVVVSLNCLLTNSLVIYLRYAFASNPFQVRSLEWGVTWDLLRTYMGGAWEQKPLIHKHCCPHTRGQIFNNN